MNITIRKSVRKKISESIPEMIDEAKSWLKIKYPEVDFENFDLIFSGAANTSRYFRNEDSESKWIKPTVTISTRDTLYLYNMKSLKIKCRIINCGDIIQTKSALIHELTHHAQYELKKPTGELETTRNEIEYLKDNYDYVYNKIMGI